ncbi:MAG: helix-turn-helix transcriptional regulator [Clostridia bacterium]|nr:helix-turn-helix transcriptional regulator [Clostridia bacterium]
MSVNKLPRGYLPNLILPTLLNGDKYGYEILKEIKEKSNDELIIKQPSLYSALSRMEKQGLVSSYWQDSELGGKRHYYSLTNLGKKQIEKLDNFIPFNSNQTLEIQNLSENSLYKYSQESQILPNEREKNIKPNNLNNLDKSNQTKQQEAQFCIQNLKDNIDSKFDLTKKFNIEQELASFKSKNESFSENLKHQKTQQNDIQTIINQQKIFLEPQKVFSDNDINKTDDFKNSFDIEKKESETFSTFQKPEQTLLPEKKSQEITQQDNEKELQVKSKTLSQSHNQTQEQNEQQKQKIENCDSGTFITEKYSLDEIPKVKQINPIQIDGIANNKTIELKKSELEYGFTEKINELYNKSKKVDEKSFVFDSTMSTPVLKDLKNYYDNKNIKISTYTNPKIQKQKQENNGQNKTENVDNISNNQNLSILQQNTYKNFNSIDFNKVNLKKSFILFLFVTIETMAIYFIFNFFNLEISYPIFYYIIPIIFFSASLYYFVLVKNNRKNYNNEVQLNSIWFDLLIILVSIILLYSINMLLGMTYENVLQYTTTFIYPCILLLNIIINYILNLIYFKKINKL